jgi:hypothetical protein
MCWRKEELRLDIAALKKVPSLDTPGFDLDQTSAGFPGLSFPRFRGHLGSHGSAVGVCHGEAKASGV